MAPAESAPEKASQGPGVAELMRFYDEVQDYLETNAAYDRIRRRRASFVVSNSSI